MEVLAGVAPIIMALTTLATTVSFSIFTFADFVPIILSDGNCWYY